MLLRGGPCRGRGRSSVGRERGGGVCICCCRRRPLLPPGVSTGGRPAAAGAAGASEAAQAPLLTGGEAKRAAGRCRSRPRRLRDTARAACSEAAAQGRPQRGRHGAQSSAGGVGPARVAGLRAGALHRGWRQSDCNARPQGAGAGRIWAVFCLLGAPRPPKSRHAARIGLFRLPIACGVSWAVGARCAGAALRSGARGGGPAGPGAGDGSSRARPTFSSGWAARGGASGACRRPSTPPAWEGGAAPAAGAAANAMAGWSAGRRTPHAWCSRKGGRRRHCSRCWGQR